MASGERGLPDEMGALELDEWRFKDEKDEKAFLKWFWEKSNGNDLIKKLNAYAQNNKADDRIRREKESPVVYAVVLNNEGIFPSERDKSKQLKLCKVGFIHRGIKRDHYNRMEQVEKEIMSKFGKKEAKASTLFALRIGAVDTTPFQGTEKRIREKVGNPVRKEIAKKRNLAMSTEWVLTTQKHIDDIIASISRAKDQDDVNQSGRDVIDVFKDIRAPDLPEGYDEWRG